MTEDIEPISELTKKRLSFICSFGYTVLLFEPHGGDRDKYTLISDKGHIVVKTRGDFYDFILENHGGVCTGKRPDFNTLKEYKDFYSPRLK